MVKTRLPDGTYTVFWGKALGKQVTAGFVVEGGYVVKWAPILARKLDKFIRSAERQIEKQLAQAKQENSPDPKFSEKP